MGGDRMRRGARLVRVAAVSVLVLSLAAGAAEKQAQTPPAFRGGVALVPVDVRVIDKDGRPVTDLKAADFTIYENDVKQEIAHFRSQAAQSLQDIGGRAFAIVLGRGRLNHPSRALDALIEFARSKVLPNDRLAVIAYFRAIEFTNDHEAIARWLERYRDRHEAIESKLVRDNARVFGPELPLAKDTRSGIDSLFDEPGTLPYHLLPAGADGRPLVFANSRHLARAIQYVGQKNGEKHVVFLSEQGLRMSPAAVENPADGYYARLASTARVALSLIYTGGVRQPPSKSGRVPIPRTLQRNSTVLMGSDYRSIAEQTGGLASLFEDTAKSLAQLERMTRFQYLLGYYPPNQASRDSRQQIRVVVNRPDVKVLYRHFYEAKTSLDDVDLKRAFAEARIEQALGWLNNPSTLSSINSGLRPSFAIAPSTDGDRRIRVDVSFNPLRVSFIKTGDRFVATPDLAVVLDDNRGAPLTRVSERLDIRLTDQEYERIKSEWLSHVVTVYVKGDPARVRAVIYDYDTDRVIYGSASLKTR